MIPTLDFHDVLPWQVKTWAVLKEYLDSDRVPQALLVNGLSGLGKFFLAQQFSQTLLCQQRQENGLACFNCSACQLFAAETHPDFLPIQPEETGKLITINQIRGLLAQLCLKPQYQQYRAVVINPADQMHQSAANAFLKCLEEPPERTVIILVADEISSLPATIVSRCQQLSIAVPTTTITQDWLQSNNITNNADILVNIALGAPLLAYNYSNDNLLAIRQSCFTDWCAIADKKDSPVQIAEKWFKLASDQLLGWLLSWVMDLIKLRSTHDQVSLVNTDLLKSLQELAEGLKLKGLFRLYDLLLNSQRRFQTQINKQLIYEEILIEWSNTRR